MNTQHQLPGQLSIEGEIKRIIRVDQAGEYGETRIYAGQCAALKHHPNLAVVQHMLAQEMTHLKKFNTLMSARRVSPSILSPLWHVAGFALGYITAKMGEQSAMACTVAIEEVIDDHYQHQEQFLSSLPQEHELLGTITQCRQEELEHKDTAIGHGASSAPLYKGMTKAIKIVSRAAIWLSSRL